MCIRDSYWNIWENLSIYKQYNNHLLIKEQNQIKTKHDSYVSKKFREQNVAATRTLTRTLKNNTYIVQT